MIVQYKSDLQVQFSIKLLSWSGRKKRDKKLYQKSYFQQEAKKLTEKDKKLKSFESFSSFKLSLGRCSLKQNRL